MDDAVPDWMLGGLESDEATGAGDESPRPVSRPIGDAPTDRITQVLRSDKKGIHAHYFQALNTEGDSIFVNMDTGESHWILPDEVSITKVQVISHKNESNQCYFEDLHNGGVSWKLPAEQMSGEAFAQVKLILKMNRKQCDTLMKQMYDRNDVMTQIEDLDMYADLVDQGYRLIDITEKMKKHKEKRERVDVIDDHKQKEAAAAAAAEAAAAEAEAAESRKSRGGGYSSMSGGMEGYDDSDDDEFTGDDPYDNFGMPFQGLKSGVIQVQIKGVGEWLQKYFILTGYALSMYEAYVSIDSKPKPPPEGEIFLNPSLVRAIAVPPSALEYSHRRNYIFIVNRAPDMILRCSVQTEREQKQWVEYINSTTQVLRQVDNFTFGSVGVYAGLMKGYEQKFFILHWQNLTIFDSEHDLTNEEAVVVITRTSRVESVDDHKGRFTVINPASAVKEKVLMQFEPDLYFRVKLHVMEQIRRAKTGEPPEGVTMEPMPMAVQNEQSALQQQHPDTRYDSSSSSSSSSSDSSSEEDERTTKFGKAPTELSRESRARLPMDSSDEDEDEDDEGSAHADNRASMGGVRKSLGDVLKSDAKLGIDGGSNPRNKDKEVEDQQRLKGEKEDQEKSLALRLNLLDLMDGAESRKKREAEQREAAIAKIKQDDEDRKRREEEAEAAKVAEEERRVEEKEKARLAEEERLRQEAAINTIQKRLFDTYKHSVGGPKDKDGDDDEEREKEDEEEEEGAEDLMDVAAVQHCCYDLGHFYSIDEALGTMEGVGDIGHETHHDVAFLTFEEFHDWWDKNSHISQARLDTPAQLRRWECLKLLRGVDRELQGWVLLHHFRELFKSISDMGFVHPSSEELRKWDPLKLYTEESGTDDSDYGHGDPKEYKDAVKKIRALSKARKVAPPSLNAPDFSQQEDEAPAGAIMYPDFVAWLDTTGADYNSAGSEKGNMFRTLAKGLGTIFSPGHEKDENELGDSSEGEGGSGKPARRHSMTERIRASFSAALGTTRSRNQEELEEIRAAEEALRKQKEGTGEKKLSALEMMAAKRKARGADKDKKKEDDDYVPPSSRPAFGSTKSPLKDKLAAVRAAREKGEGKGKGKRKDSKGDGASASTSAGATTSRTGAADESKGSEDEEPLTRHSVVQKTNLFADVDDETPTGGAFTLSGVIPMKGPDEDDSYDSGFEDGLMGPPSDGGTQLPFASSSSSPDKQATKGKKDKKKRKSKAGAGKRRRELKHSATSYRDHYSEDLFLGETEMNRAWHRGLRRKSGTRWIGDSDSGMDQDKMYFGYGDSSEEEGSPYNEAVVEVDEYGRAYTKRHLKEGLSPRGLGAGGAYADLPASPTAVRSRQLALLEGLGTPESKDGPSGDDDDVPQHRSFPYPFGASSSTRGSPLALRSDHRDGSRSPFVSSHAAAAADVSRAAADTNTGTGAGAGVFSIAQRKKVRSFNPEVDYDTASEEEEEEEEAGAEAEADRRGQDHHHKIVAVNLNDLMADLPAVERWEQPVSKLLVPHSGQVNSHTGNKVLTARPPDTSGFDEFAAAIMGVDPEEAARAAEEASASSTLAAAAARQQLEAAARKTKASRRVSHLFIPDKGLLPPHLASLPEAAGEGEGPEEAAGAGAGAGAGKSRAKAGAGGKKSRRSSVTVGAINRATALSSAAARRGSTVGPGGALIAGVPTRDVSVQTGVSSKRRGASSSSAVSRYGAGHLSAPGILHSHKKLRDGVEGEVWEEEAIDADNWQSLHKQGEYTLSISPDRTSIQGTIGSPISTDTGRAKGASGEGATTAKPKKRTAHFADEVGSKGLLRLSDMAQDSALAQQQQLHRQLDMEGGHGAEAEMEHVPKSAFHLILGERFAVEEVWARVASEEKAILEEIEHEEDKAMQRIRVEEAESLAKVQKAWVDRQEWLTQARDALRVQRELMARDQKELDSRKHHVGSKYKEQTSAFGAAFEALNKHHRAITKEVKALRRTSAKAEMTNVLLSEQIRHASNELTRAKNAAFVEEEALKAELRSLLPHYAAPLDLSNIKGPQSLHGEGGSGDGKGKGKGVGRATEVGIDPLGDGSAQGMAQYLRYQPPNERNKHSLGGGRGKGGGGGGAGSLGEKISAANLAAATGGLKYGRTIHVYDHLSEVYGYSDPHDFYKSMRELQTYEVGSGFRPSLEALSGVNSDPGPGVSAAGTLTPGKMSLRAVKVREGDASSTGQGQGEGHSPVLPFYEQGSSRSNGEGDDEDNAGSSTSISLGKAVPKKRKTNNLYVDPAAGPRFMPTPPKVPPPRVKEEEEDQEEEGEKEGADMELGGATDLLVSGRQAEREVAAFMRLSPSPPPKPPSSNPNLNPKGAIKQGAQQRQPLPGVLSATAPPPSSKADSHAEGDYFDDTVVARNQYWERGPHDSRPDREKAFQPAMSWRSDEDQQRLERFKTLKEKSRAAGYGGASVLKQKQKVKEEEEAEAEGEGQRAWPGHSSADLDAIHQRVAPFAEAGDGRHSEEAPHDTQKHHRRPLPHHDRAFDVMSAGYNTGSDLHTDLDPAGGTIDLGTGHGRRKASLPPQARGVAARNANFGFSSGALYGSGPNGDGAEEHKVWTDSHRAGSRGSVPKASKVMKEKKKRSEKPAWGK